LLLSAHHYLAGQTTLQKIKKIIFKTPWNPHLNYNYCLNTSHLHSSITFPTVDHVTCSVTYLRIALIEDKLS
jgi:hypothetical protein